MPGFFPKDAKILVIGMNPGQLHKRQSGWDDSSYSESEQWSHFQQGYAKGLFEAPIGKYLKEGLQGGVPWAFTNIVKCRTPDNKPPTFEEIANCRPWLEKQISEIDPWAIITLGNVAHAWFFDKDALVSSDRVNKRPRFMERSYWRGIYMMLYHPSYMQYQMDKKTKLAFQGIELIVSNRKLYQDFLNNGQAI